MNSSGPSRSLEAGDQLHDFGQRGRQVVPLIEEPAELGGHPRLLAALQFEQHMLLAGEVEEEGPVRHACGGDDRMNVGAATFLRA